MKMVIFTVETKKQKPFGVLKDFLTHKEVFRISLSGLKNVDPLEYTKAVYRYIQERDALAMEWQRRVEKISQDFEDEWSRPVVTFL